MAGFCPASVVIGTVLNPAASREAKRRQSQPDIQKQGVGIAPACFIVGKFMEKQEHENNGT